MLYVANALCSINDRLAGGDGWEMPPIEGDFLTDLLLFNAKDQGDADELEEEARRRHRLSEFY